MQSNKKASGRKPKKTTKTVIREVVNLPQTAKRTRRPTGRSGPRSFQQPNPKRNSNPSPTIRNSKRGDVASIPGNDLVATLAVPEEKKFSAGDILVNVPLNPVLMALPRLLALSKLYKRFRIASMVFEYEPTATIQPGSLLGFVDYDAFDDPTVGTPLQRLQRARATYGEKGVNITNRGTWSVIPMKDTLYISSDLASNSHWSEYGRFVIYANSDIAVGVACGSVTVKYVVEFSHPSYETPATTFSVLQGYAWADTYSSSQEKITSSIVLGGSNLPGTAIITPSSGYSATITLPYDPVSDDLNWFMIGGVVGPNINVQWGLDGTPVGAAFYWFGKAEGSATGSSTFIGAIHTLAAVNNVHIGTGLLTVDGGGEWYITRMPHFGNIPSKSDSVEKKKVVEEKKKVEETASRYPVSQSSSSASSGVSKSLTSPTPVNSPAVGSGWFRV